MNTIARLPKRLTLPEPATEQSLFRWRHDLATFLQNVALNMGIDQFDAGHIVTGDVTFSSNANDADTVTITVDGEALIYEFDNNASVTAGRVLVTIGANAAATALNLANAIAANSQGARLTATRHATDTSVVDIAGRVTGHALTLAESTAGARITVQDNANERGQETLYSFSRRCVVTAHDVTRARIVINTGMSALVFWSVFIQTSATVPTATAYNGAVTVTNGVIEIDNSGGSDFSAGNLILVNAQGRRI